MAWYDHTTIPCILSLLYRGFRGTWYDLRKVTIPSFFTQSDPILTPIFIPLFFTLGKHIVPFLPRNNAQLYCLIIGCPCDLRRERHEISEQWATHLVCQAISPFIVRYVFIFFHSSSLSHIRKQRCIIINPILCHLCILRVQLD